MVIPQSAPPPSLPPCNLYTPKYQFFSFLTSFPSFFTLFVSRQTFKHSSLSPLTYSPPLLPSQFTGTPKSQPILPLYYLLCFPLVYTPNYWYSSHLYKILLLRSFQSLSSLPCILQTPKHSLLSSFILLNTPSSLLSYS